MVGMQFRITLHKQPHGLPKEELQCGVLQGLGFRGLCRFCNQDLRLAYSILHQGLGLGCGVEVLGLRILSLEFRVQRLGS